MVESLVRLLDIEGSKFLGVSIVYLLHLRPWIDDGYPEGARGIGKRCMVRRGRGLSEIGGAGLHDDEKRNPQRVGFFFQLSQ